MCKRRCGVISDQQAAIEAEATSNSHEDHLDFLRAGYDSNDSNLNFSLIIYACKSDGSIIKLW